MPDVVVVGGGVIGLAIAWRTAAAGADVSVVDPAPGSGASRVAAGMLAPVGEAQFGEERLSALALESWRRYPDFIAALEAAAGCETGYRKCGSLFVARDSDEWAALSRDAGFRAGLGLDIVALNSQECRRVEPRLAPRTRGGLLVEGDHQVDPRLVLRALLSACDRAGVTVCRESATIRAGRDRVVGVTAGDSGDITADTVVLAAGCWSPLVPGLPAHAIPPVRPVKGQILRLRTRDGAALAGHVIRGRDAYLVPRDDGTVVVGATVEERGHDTAVTAGAVSDLLRDARELIPDVAELELVEASAGLRPGTPDNGPIIGWSGVDGLLIATGHYRNGILLTPITADAVSALVRGDDSPAVARPFTPDRFATAAAVAG
ncbi:MAG: glycine oxidase ThiO [Candidatus Dormibacteria bacterium]